MSDVRLTERERALIIKVIQGGCMRCGRWARGHRYCVPCEDANEQERVESMLKLIAGRRALKENSDGK